MGSQSSSAREQILLELAELFGGVFGEDSRISHRGRSKAYRRAIRYIDRSLSTANSDSAAAAAGVSVRVLQLAFRENLGISPQRYIRLCRLNQLHSKLLASRAGVASVTTLMQESGFSEFGRVAERYRRLFGELPSQTLGHMS